MRTAKTTAIKHDGSEVLLAGKLVPLLEQKKKFQQLRGSRAHAEFREVSYQESDGWEEVIRLLTPAANIAQQNQRAKEAAVAKAAGAALTKKHSESGKKQPATKIGASADQAAATAAAATANSESGLKFTREELLKKNKGELLALGAELFATGRLLAAPGGSKSDVIESILTATPKPEEPTT